MGQAMAISDKSLYTTRDLPTSSAHSKAAPLGADAQENA